MVYQCDVYMVKLTQWDLLTFLTVQWKRVEHLLLRLSTGTVWLEKALYPTTSSHVPLFHQASSRAALDPGLIFEPVLHVSTAGSRVDLIQHES